MITKSATVYFSGNRYIFAAFTKMPEGFWQVCYVSEPIVEVSERELGTSVIDALARSGDMVKETSVNSKVSAAGKMLGFRSEKSFVDETRAVKVELEDGRVRVTRMVSDLKYKAFMYSEDTLFVELNPDEVGGAVRSLVSSVE